MQRDLITIFGVDIDNVTADEAGEITANLVETSNKSCKIIVAPNVEFIMEAQKDKKFYDVLKKASLATPDSIGVEIGTKLQKKKLKERIPRTSLF